jgi:hypothetical protein
MSRGSSSAFGYRHERCASICRSVWTEAPASACSPSFGQRLQQLREAIPSDHTYRFL